MLNFKCFGMDPRGFSGKIMVPGLSASVARLVKNYHFILFFFFIGT